VADLEANPGRPDGGLLAWPPARKRQRGHGRAPYATGLECSAATCSTGEWSHWANASIVLARCAPGPGRSTATRAPRPAAYVQLNCVMESTIFLSALQIEVLERSRRDQAVMVIWPGDFPRWLSAGTPLRRSVKGGRQSDHPQPCAASMPGRLVPLVALFEAGRWPSAELVNIKLRPPVCGGRKKAAARILDLQPDRALLCRWRNPQPGR